MRTTLTLLVGATVMLGACGDSEPPTGAGSGSTTPSSSSTTRDLPSRAVTTPGSVTEFEGVLVRYDEPAGEGPGFDLRFLGDGTVVYLFLANDPQPFDTVRATFDVDRLRTLLEGLEPTDIAVGADDCMPEVDGSAPRLSVDTFEVDYCYTDPTDHELVELVRSTRARLDAELDVLNTPGPDGIAFPAPDGFDGVLARYSMPGGECDRCDFETTFGADGTLRLRSTRGDHDGTFDPAKLRDLVDAFDPEAFVTGETDCGREVDGNAPVLAVPGAVIDLCFWDSDPSDPVYVFVVNEHARVVAERDTLAVGTAIVARVTWTGGLSEDGTSSSILELRADGTWSRDDGNSIEQGTYDAAPLVSAITTEHVGSPVLGPFTDECPTASDGAELSYELIDPATAEIVLATSTCTDELDPEHPLIAAVTAAVDAARAG